MVFLYILILFFLFGEKAGGGLGGSVVEVEGEDGAEGKA